MTPRCAENRTTHTGVSVYILGTLVCALAPTMTALIGGRFLQALGASASAVITAAIAPRTAGSLRQTAR